MDNKKLNITFDKLKAEIYDLDNSITQVKDENFKKINIIEQSLGNTSTQVNNLSSTVEEFSNQISSFSYSINDLSNKIDNLQASLANCAKNDFSNVTYPTNTLGSTTTGSGDRVINTYISSDGKTWARIWASGWKECSTQGTSNASSTRKELTLPITFSTTKYTVMGSTNNDSYAVALRLKIVSENKVSISTTVQGQGHYSSSVTIYCCGY